MRTKTLPSEIEPSRYEEINEQMACQKKVLIGLRKGCKKRLGEYLRPHVLAYSSEEKDYGFPVGWVEE